MIGNLQFYRGTGTNPYDNLAVESYFLQHCPPETCIFYLWQNQRTVVIGKNQNAWQECNVGYQSRKTDFWHAVLPAAERSSTIWETSISPLLHRPGITMSAGS